MRFLSSLLVVLALVCLSFSPVSALSACKDLDVNDVPGCRLKCHACQTFKVFASDTFDVSFMDYSNGVWSQRYENKDKNWSGQMALVDLFQRSRGCNCYSLFNETNYINLGHCSIRARVCFMFTSRDNLLNKVASYDVVLEDRYHATTIVQRANTQDDIQTALATAVYNFYNTPSLGLCFDAGDSPYCKSCQWMNQVCPSSSCDYSCIDYGTNMCRAEDMAANGCPATIPPASGPYQGWTEECNTMTGGGGNVSARRAINYGTDIFDKEYVNNVVGQMDQYINDMLKQVDME